MYSRACFAAQRWTTGRRAFAQRRYRPCSKAVSLLPVPPGFPLTQNVMQLMGMGTIPVPSIQRKRTEIHLRALAER